MYIKLEYNGSTFHIPNKVAFTRNGTGDSAGSLNNDFLTLDHVYSTTGDNISRRFDLYDNDTSLAFTNPSSILIVPDDNTKPYLTLYLEFAHLKIVLFNANSGIELDFATATQYFQGINCTIGLAKREAILVPSDTVDETISTMPLLQDDEKIVTVGNTYSSIEVLPGHAIYIPQ